MRDDDEAMRGVSILFLGGFLIASVPWWLKAYCVIMGVFFIFIVCSVKR